jgi:hypothetical protein
MVFPLSNLIRNWAILVKICYIFAYLKESEYFVFIDFKRERIKSGKFRLEKKKSNKFRGSLFVNQEIAIATFLKLQGIGFLEKGVKREGILNYQIYNAIPLLQCPQGQKAQGRS